MSDLKLDQIDLGGFGINEAEPVQPVVAEAMKVDPNTYASNLNLAQQSGMPEAAVKTDPTQVANKLKLDQIDFTQMSKRNPVTSGFFTDFNNAAIAHDEIDLMAEIEDWFDFSKTFENLSETASLDFQRQGKGFQLKSNESSADTISNLIPAGALPVGVQDFSFEMSRQFAEASGIESDEQLQEIKAETSERLIGEIRTIIDKREKATPEDMNLLETGVRAGVDSLINMLPGTALMVASGGRAAPMLGVMGTQVYSDSYGDARAEGLTEDQASTKASIDAAVNIATEYLPTKTLEKIFSGKSEGFLKSTKEFAVREGLTEQIATLGETVNAYAFGLDEELENASTLTEMIDIQIERQVITAIATVVAGGTQLSAVQGLNKVLEKVTRREQVQQSKAQADQARINALNESTGKSELRARNEKAFRDFLNQADGDNNSQIYMDGVQAALYLREKTRAEIDADPALQLIEERVREAGDVQNDVLSIPVADFATHITGTEHFDALRDFMTMDPAIASPYRAEQQAQELKEYTQRLIKEADTNSSEFIAAQEIFTSVRNQLVDSGQVSAQAASVMAEIVPAWATVFAKKNNITVEEAFRRGGLSIEGPQTGEAARLAAEAEQLQQTPAFEGIKVGTENRGGYFSDSMEVTVGPRAGRTDYTVDVARADGTSNTGFRIQNALTQSFETVEEAVAYGNKFAKKDHDKRARLEGEAARLEGQLLQVAEGNSSAQEFESALDSARKSNPNAPSVAQYDVSEYETMSTFLLDDGKAGYAIEDDGNLVGVFKSPESKMTNALDTIVPEAIANGATKLNAFEGFLTEQYAKYGFVEVARDPWNEQFKPDGWTEAMGTPDVVYMELQNENQSTDARSVQDTSRVRGSDGVLAQQNETSQGRDEEGNLGGLPTKVGDFEAGVSLSVTKVAEDYMASTGMEYTPVEDYAAVDVQRAQRIAQAYEDMPHDPTNPDVLAAYDAMIEETVAMYKAAIDAGLVVEFINFDEQGDPYEASPRMMTDDVNQNNHMWVFSTRDGFGSDDTFDPVDNPLLRETEFEISGQKALVNDLFRVVHDYFGYVKEGVGFRARGEENAWRVHSTMYSPLARKAMTTETRGQNSWVNYGPHGESNQTASAAETHYADQKIGLLPDWAVKDDLFEENKDRNKDFSTSQQMLRESSTRLNQEVEQTETEEFKAWAENGEVVESYDISDHNFKEDTPVVLRVFHGTTHDFDTFEASRGSSEGEFGAINYFTSSEFDASENYAGEGPDLTSRIQQRVEQIENDPEEFGLDPDADNSEIAMEMARDELSGGGENILELFVKFKNPFVIGDNQFLEFRNYDEDSQAALEEVASDESVDVAEIEENRDDYEDQIDDAYHRIVEDNPDMLSEAVEAVAIENGLDMQELMGAVYELTHEGATADALEQMLRESESISYAEDPDTGGLIGFQLVADVIQKMGYDAIILKNANERFSTMSMEPNTTHIHIFEPDKTNIKSVENEGTFDNSDPNIFKQDVRGYFDPSNSLIRLNESSNLSTFLHEFAHFMYQMELNTNSPTIQSINSWFKRNAEDVAKEANGYIEGVGPYSQKDAAETLARRNYLIRKGLNDGREMADQMDYIFVLRSTGSPFDLERAARIEKDLIDAYDMFFANKGAPAEGTAPDNVIKLYQDSGRESDEQSKQQNGDRKQRAREQGFDVDNVYYHGTSADISEFRETKNGKLGEGGVYLTNSPEWASGYGKISVPIRGGNANVVPVYLRMGKVLEVHVSDSLSNKRIPDLKSQGFDAVIIRNSYTEGVDEVVIFDPKNIRSVNAQFNNPESADLLAQTDEQSSQKGAITAEKVIQFLDEGTTGSASEDAAIRRAVHEQFARGFEKYLMEGTAPSVELRNAFRTFARWLVEIYKKMRSSLNPENIKLDKEMREVFDRLLATDEQIQMANIRSQFEPMFTDAAMAGMTETDYEAYLDKQSKAEDKATETLRDKMIKEITRQTKKQWKEEKADLVNEKTIELSNTPVYRAVNSMKSGDLKLDHATVKDMVGEERTNKLGRTSIVIPSKLSRMTAKGAKGVHPDEAAAFYGFNSGSEMLDAIVTEPTLKEAAEQQAQDAMLEKHGDILNDGTIEKLADEAVQNEERGKVILQELKALNKQVSKPAMERAAIKSLAEGAIAKKAFREIHPAKYRSAEIRAAQEAAKMLAEGNVEGAATAKARQVMNYYLGMAATAAKTDTLKIVDRMSRYNKKDVREAIMKAENGYWEQLVKILNRFEFRKSASLNSVNEQNESIQAWAANRAENDGDALVLSAAVLDESYVTHWKNIAYGDLVGVSDSIKNIEHVARYSNKMNMMQDEVDFQKLVTQWVAHMNDVAEDRFTAQRTTVVEGKNWGRWAMAQMTKIPYMASWMDGGERAGMSHDILVQPLTDAYREEMRLWDTAGAEVMSLIEGRSKEDLKRHNRKIFIREIQDEKNDGNLMGHQVLAVALNTGNQGNLRKMILGEGWGDPEVDTDISLDNPQLKAVLSHMTKSDWQLVQKIWDQMELLYPKLAEVHRRTTGLTPPKVESTPVVTEFGTFNGGYYPVKYDPNRSFRAQQNEDKLNAETESMFGQGSIQASVSASSTNERTGYYAPVRLSLDIVPNHFQETIHYITHHDAVRQINKLIRNPSVADTITKKLGPEEFKQLKPWLNDVAKDGRDAPAKTFIDSVLGRLRFGTTLGVMGFKASTGIIQISGLSNTMAEVGAAPTFQAMKTVLGSPATIRSAWDFAVSNSKVLAHRTKTMDREIRNAMQRIEGKKGFYAAAQELSMKHIAYIQTYMVDLPSWHAAYIKSLKEYGDEQRAYRYADWVIENVQGSGLTKDMAGLLRNQNEPMRMMTMFMTFFSALWNLQRDAVKGAKSGKYSVTTVGAKVMFLLTLPVLFESIMRGEFDDEDEWLEELEKMTFKTAMFPVQSVPFLRDAANSVTTDFGYNISPIAALLEKGLQSTPEVIERALTDEEITKGQVKNSSKFAGALLGLPGTGQAWASGEHLYDVIAEGEEFTMHQFLFGPKREED